MKGIQTKKQAAEVAEAGKRLLSIPDLMIYLSLGRSRALAIGEECGAKRKLGKRTLYDKKIIDEYIDNLPAASGTEG